MKLEDFDFRVWSKKERKYINKECVKGFMFGNNKKSDDLEIELFIGRYDKAGKKVYEGDILEFYNGEYYDNCSVLYNEGEARFVAITDDGEEDLTWFSDIKVVGNIHRNLELLKPKESK